MDEGVDGWGGGEGLWAAEGGFFFTLRFERGPALHFFFILFFLRRDGIECVRLILQFCFGWWVWHGVAWRIWTMVDAGARAPDRKSTGEQHRGVQSRESSTVLHGHDDAHDRRGGRPVEDSEGVRRPFAFSPDVPRVLTFLSPPSTLSVR